jgi:hypothetical protein
LYQITLIAEREEKEVEEKEKREKNNTTQPPSTTSVEVEWVGCQLIRGLRGHLHGTPDRQV